MPEIRCEAKLHGIVAENSTGILEIVCKDRYCKARPDEVVTHRWNLEKVNEDNTIRPVQTFRTKRPEVKGLIR